MKVNTIYLRMKNKFSHILNILKLKDFEQDFSLKSDFSRRHLCSNPPDLTGGRLIDFVCFTIASPTKCRCTHVHLKSSSEVSSSIMPNFLG